MQSLPFHQIASQPMEPDRNDQDLINAVHRKENDAAKELYGRFSIALKIYLNQQNCFDRDLHYELVMKSFVILFNKREPPLITIKAHSYMLSIAKKLLLLFLTRKKEKYFSFNQIDSFPSLDDVIEIMEIEEEFKLLNELISRLSPRCQELLEKVLTEDVTETICTEMGYISMNMLYKKKSICVSRLRALGLNDDKFCEFYDNE